MPSDRQVSGALDRERGSQLVDRHRTSESANEMEYAFMTVAFQHDKILCQGAVTVADDTF